MATVSERLALIITASTGGAVRGLREVAAASREMKAGVGASEKELAALQKRADAAANTLKSGLGITALQSKLALLGPTGARVATGIDSITASVTGMGAATLGATVVGIAGFALLAKATGSGVRQYENIADEARRVQYATGASAEEASRFAGAMRLLGTDIDKGALVSLSILAKKIRDTPQELEKQGVAIARNKQGYADLEQTLFNVADRYKAMVDAGNTSEARAFARQTLGRGFIAFEQLLVRGSEGLKKFYAIVGENHEVLSQDDIDKARELQIAGAELSQAWQGVEVELARNVVPALITLTEWMTKAIHLADALHGTKGPVWLQSVKNIAIPGMGKNPLANQPGEGKGKGPFSWVDDRIPAIRRIDEALGAYKKRTDDASTSDRDFNRAAQELKLSLKEEAKALESARSAIDSAIAADQNLVSATHGVEQADRGVISARRGVVTAVRGVRDAREHLNDVLAQGAEVTHRITEAQRALIKSDQNVADAEERVLAARKAINDLKAGPSPKDREKAELAVKEATLGVAQANQSVLDAQNRLDEAKHPKPGGNRFAAADPEKQAEDIAAAELDLAQAQLGVESAALTLSDAQDDLNTLMDAGKEGSEQLTAAQKELKRAEDDLEQATHDHAEAQRALNDAEKGVADHERDIRDAREGLASATQAVTDATDAVAEAEYNAARAREAYTTAILNSAKAHDQEMRQIDENLAGLKLLRTELEGLVGVYPQLQPILDRINADILYNYNHLSGVPEAGSPQGRRQVGTAAYGDIYSQPTAAIFGEAGPEMVLPLSPNKRAYALRLLAQSGLTRDLLPHFGKGAIVGSSARSNWQHTGATARNEYNLTVYASGRAEGQAAGAEIVDALKRWARRNGPIPVRVTG